jgi:phosphodiesterase/alkaline phosphatase D-like protein
VVFNGSVDPSGNSTAVTFEFGTTTAYGRMVAADQSPVSGYGDTAVSATVGGFVPGVTYHYRVVAENAVGTVYGDDQEFVAGAFAAAIPTLGGPAVLLLIALLMTTGILSIRRVS